MSAPGPIAQLEERLNGIEEVVGSSPTGSTRVFAIEPHTVSLRSQPREALTGSGIKRRLRMVDIIDALSNLEWTIAHPDQPTDTTHLLITSSQGLSFIAMANLSLGSPLQDQLSRHVGGSYGGT